MAKAHYSQTVFNSIGTGAAGDPDVVGIEIEAEGVPPGLVFPPVVAKTWNVHTDGSLRDGIEFVSAGPQNPKDVGVQVKALSAECSKLKYTPVFSYRTSVHVHVNVGDLNYVQLVNLWTLYTVFESVLFEMAGPERKGNVHCISPVDATQVTKRLRFMFKDDPGDKEGFNFSDGRQRLMSRDMRYAAFNWASVRQFGTIEFRIHRGTADPVQIQAWVDALMCLKLAARDTFKDPQEIVEQLSLQTPAEIAATVFGRDHFVTTNLGRFTGEIWEAIRVVQDVAFVRKSWEAGKKTTAKKGQPAVNLNSVFTEAEPFQRTVQNDEQPRAFRRRNVPQDIPAFAIMDDE